MLGLVVKFQLLPSIDTSTNAGTEVDVVSRFEDELLLRDFVVTSAVLFVESGAVSGLYRELHLLNQCSRERRC